MSILITEKTYRRAALIILLLCAAVVLLTFKNYGISWDEEIQSQYGQAIFDYYNSGLADHRYNQLFNLYLYGGMFDGLAAFFDAYTPIGIYATRHLLNALIGLLGLWGAWRLGRLFGGGQVGLLTLVLLVLTPMYYGHMFNNPKDIPFAAGVVWTLYYMTKSLRSFPNVPWKTIFMAGLTLGLTLGVRVGGIMLLGYWGLTLGLLALSMMQAWSRPWQITRPIIRIIIPATLLAYAVMLICWPWAQEAPLANPIIAFEEFSNFPQKVEVLLHGITYMSTNLPWHYVPLYLAVQLPLLQLILVFFALILLPWIIRGQKSQADRYALCLVLLTVFVPVFYAVIKHPALYDAIRHFIFILPLLSLFEALALQRMLKLAQESKIMAYVQFALIPFSITLAAIPVATMIQLHPYEYIYANVLAGGVKGAFGHYELDYWGTSFKEAAEKLQEYVAREGGIPPGKMTRVAVCGPWSAAVNYLPPDYEAVEADKPAEFFLATTRWMCQNMRQGKNVIEVKRLGVPLSVIKDLRNQPEYKPEPDK